MQRISISSRRWSLIGWCNMSCWWRKIDCASATVPIAHGYLLTARKLHVGVGATWGCAGTLPSPAASMHARDNGEPTHVRKSTNAPEASSQIATCKNLFTGYNAHDNMLDTKNKQTTNN